MSDDEHEQLDPRIQQELERLNKASLLINKLENDLDDARGKFRSLLTESTQQLGGLSKRFGSCIDKSKQYYDARLQAKEVQIQAFQAATMYEKAMSKQTAAREMVDLAEQGYQTKKMEGEQASMDTAWQEMLNHATIKVMEAEDERMVSEGEHMRRAKAYTEVQDAVNDQYKSHKRSIAKSKEYYETKAQFHTCLETQKQCIEKLQVDVDSAKKVYSKALGSLEKISEEIHENRKQRKASKILGKREAGVGSESPIPPPLDPKLETKPNNNNNKEAEEEILISFPPAVTKPDNPRSSQSNAQTEVLELTKSDEPINISGIKINVMPASGKAVEEDNSIISFHLAENNSSERISTLDRPDTVEGGSAASSVDTSPVVMRHKRVLSGSIKLSAKRLLQETSSIDSDSGSVNSFVALDDDRVRNAMSEQFFEGSFEAELRKSTHEDYSQLPESLSKYQKPYESTRRSVQTFSSLEDVDLKLDQVLKFLESTDDESIV